MRPIKTAECNVVYQGDGANIVDIHAEQITNESVSSFDGAKEVRLFWEPDEKERERISEGWNIRIHMLGGVSPHWVEVVDAPEEDGE